MERKVTIWLSAHELSVVNSVKSTLFEDIHHITYSGIRTNALSKHGQLVFKISRTVASLEGAKLCNPFVFRFVFVLTCHNRKWPIKMSTE